MASSYLIEFSIHRCFCTKLQKPVRLIFGEKKHGEQHSVILSENQIPVRGVKGPSRPHRQWQISWRYFGSEGFRILERGFLEVRKRICQISWQKILYISEQRLFRRPDLVMEHKAWKNLWVHLQCIWPGILNSSKQREIHLVRRHYGLSPSFSLLIWRGKRSWPLASPLVLVSWPLLQALTTLRNFNGRLKQWWFCSRDTRNACLNCCCCCCYCCCCCCCCCCCWWWWWLWMTKVISCAPCWHLW